MNLMQQYINEQPEVLRMIINDRQNLTAGFVEKYRQQKIDRLVIIGSGSSYNAGLMAKPLVERCIGVEVIVTVPTRLGELIHLPSQNVLYCVLSQGGRSTNTLQVIRELKQNQCSTVAVTECGNSPISQFADKNLHLPIGEENIGAKTKGVTATTLVLMLAFLELGLSRGEIERNFYELSIESLVFITDNMDENIRRAITWCEVIDPMICHLTSANIIAKGNDYGAAMEGRLKLLETIWKPVIYYEFEEYLHGPENALDANTCGLLFLPDDKDAIRVERLADFANSKGARYLLIDRLDRHVAKENLSLISAGNAYLTCFELLPPLQTLSAQLSTYLGNDLSKPKFPEFYELMGTKLK